MNELELKAVSFTYESTATADRQIRPDAKITRWPLYPIAISSR